MTQAINVPELIRASGLRPTRQRLLLAELLFGRGHRHATAEMLHVEVVAAGERVSLATVYNTLHQFTQAGLLRELAVDGAKTYFDTNPSDHHHFFIEGEDRMIDVPSNAIRVAELPALPEGMEVSRIEVIVRLKPKAV